MYWCRCDGAIGVMTPVATDLAADKGVGVELGTVARA
jgi:hypothetical protein